LNNKTNTFYQELSVKSTTDNLSLIREFTKDAAKQCGFSEDVIGKIILAVDEACTNIIKHAYKFAENGNINISVKFADSKFEISITDEGIHFNPDSIPEPDIKEYYKQKKVGGLGVYLIRKLMDDVKYSTLTGNKNQVTLVKYLSR
jgi:serine/threonine-protein kinase RsbW